jgi:dTDP-glucose 4,6-dehydratase/UDP-glucose 4-epimerase
VPFPEERKAIDIGDYYSDFSLISKELDWLPQTGLQKGLLNTIEYYSKHKFAYWDET